MSELRLFAEIVGWIVIVRTALRLYRTVFSDRTGNSGRMGHWTGEKL